MVSLEVHAAILDYNPPQILARANIHDGYNIPPMSFLNNTSPVINNNGDVTFKILGAEGVNNQSLWFKNGKESSGKIIYTAPDERLLTEPSLNDNGMITFNLYDEGVTDGLFLLDTKTSEVEQVLAPDNVDIQFYTYPQLTSNNHIFFRATDDKEVRLLYEFNGLKLNKLFKEGTENFGMKSSYLFRPSVNGSGQVAFKIRLGEPGQWAESNPDSIVLLSSVTEGTNSTSKLVTIASDQDSDKNSLYKQFGNSVSLSGKGNMAFMAVLKDSKKAIVGFKNNVLLNYALEGQNDISEIETMNPKINDQGLILFCAKDLSGKRGLYLADGVLVKRIIGEGDPVETDVGPGSILYNPNFPGLGGEIDMNDLGEIVFSSIVISKDEKELGSAIYKITPQM